MTQFEIISCIIAGTAIVVAAFATYFTYKNLQEIRNQFFEQNRGSLVFFIEKTNSTQFHSLIIKNFGMSAAKLISIKITPDLDWSKTKSGMSETFNIANCKNVLLAPGKFIESKFMFDGYPDNEFQVELSYATSGKHIHDSFDVDLGYTHILVSANINIKDELGALEEINHSIQDLSNKFI